VDKRDLPHISVLVTTYNHDRYIAKALDSVLTQRGDFTFELLIGEDCSTDRTREIVLAYATNWPDRIRLELPEENLGKGGNALLRRLMQAATGEYIALLDGDDYWTSGEKLAKQVGFLEAHPDCAVCFHGARVIYEGATRQPELFNEDVPKQLSTLEDLLRGNFIQMGTVMYRRPPGEFDPAAIERAEFGDHVLHLLLAQQGAIGYIDEVMSVYRVHKGGVWSGRDYDFDAGRWNPTGIEYLLAHIEVLEVAESVLDPAYRGAVRRERAVAHFELSSAYASVGELALARQHLVFSWRLGWQGTRISLLERGRGVVRVVAPSLYARGRQLRRALRPGSRR
jgi:glycosyltransferase involved in cell wall biosynthesis